MVSQDGSFTIDWDSKLSELQKAATAAYVKEQNMLAALSNTKPPFFGENLDTVQSSFDWIREAFEPLRNIAHPKNSRAMADSIVKITGSNGSSSGDGEAEPSFDASGGLLTGKALHGDVNHYTTEWTGNGATSFTEFFDDVPAVIDNQMAVTKLLGMAMEVNQGLLICARQDAEKIPEAAIASLEALHSGGGDGAEDGAVALSILAAVATVGAGIATMFTGGGAAPILAGTLTVAAGLSSGGALALQASADAGPEEEVPIDGNTVEQVLTGMSNAVNKVISTLTEGENLLIEKLDATTAVLQGSGRDEFIAPRPQTFIDDGAAKFRPTG